VVEYVDQGLFGFAWDVWILCIMVMVVCFADGRPREKGDVWFVAVL